MPGSPCANAAVASMSAQVRSSATTVTDADASGHVARAGVDDVRRPGGSAPTWRRLRCARGRRRRPGWGRAGPRCRCARPRAAGTGDPADHVTARGQADVGVGEDVERVRGALHRPALHDAAGVEHRTTRRASGRRTSKAPPDCTRARSPSASTSRDLGRAVRDRDLAAAQPGHAGVGPVGAEHPVDLVQHGQRASSRRPRRTGRRRAGRAARG